MENNTVNSNPGIQDVDFITGKGVGLYEIVKGFNKSIMIKASVMITIEDALKGLNKFINKLSLRLKTDGIASAKAEYNYAIVSSIAMGLAVFGTCSLMSLSVPEEGMEPTMLQKFHQILGIYGPKAIIGSQVMIGVLGAYYALQKGRYGSDKTKIQGANAELTPLIDRYGQSMNSNSSTINFDMKAIKTTIENDYYASKAR